MAPSQEPPSICDYCQQLAKNNGHDPRCRALDFTEYDEETIAQLMRELPFAHWKTPRQVGSENGYSAKHVIRVATESDNQIVFALIERRYFLLECTFARYTLKNRHKP